MDGDVFGGSTEGDDLEGGGGEVDGLVEERDGF